MTKFNILDCHKTPEIEKRLPEHFDRLLASKEKLKIIRENSLRKILSFAKKNSPWYQKSLAHINVEKITEERLQELPILTKKIVMDNWDEIVTDPRLEPTESRSSHG